MPMKSRVRICWGVRALERVPLQLPVEVDGSFCTTACVLLDPVTGSAGSSSTISGTAAARHSQEATDSWWLQLARVCVEDWIE